MTPYHFMKKYWLIILLMFSLSISMIGCANAGNNLASPTANGAQADQDEHDEHDEHEAHGEALLLPKLQAINLQGERLRVVATTSIIGDVVANIGGGAIDLTVLMGPGQDPHSFAPGAAQLTAVARAHVIFVNGWGLEERLLTDLEAIGEGVPIVPISANVSPIEFGQAGHHDEQEEDEHKGDGHDHHGADPHVWFSIAAVEQWTQNTQEILSTLDPNNSSHFTTNAQQYLAQLGELRQYATTQLAAIPAKQRVLVTNHDAFAYFAQDFTFEVLGTVIPSTSTLAEPSAADLADLITIMKAEGVCTLFTESTVSDKLAQTVAAELGNCDRMSVLPLYTGALGSTGSGAESYLGMFRTNVDTIVRGLTQ